MIALPSVLRTGSHSRAEKQPRSQWTAANGLVCWIEHPRRVRSSRDHREAVPPLNLGENHAHSFQPLSARRDEVEGKRQGAVSRSVLD
jgi:hypothetical protein